MRLSIWNQFASNHSGSMTIVGTFKTVEQAIEAEKAFRQIVLEINQWFERPENARFSNSWMGDPPTPIETELIRKYELPTNKPLGIYQNDIHITTISNLVQLCIDETRWAYQLYPLKDLLLRLGAEHTAIDHQAEGETIAQAQYHLTCTIPSEQSCQEETEAYLSDLIASSVDDDIAPDDFFEIAVERSQMTIHLQLGAPPNDEDLQDLYMFLQSCGCTQIQWQVEEG